MASNCDGTVIKKECTETWDIIIERPIEGPVRMHKQGPGVSRAIVNITGDGASGCSRMFGACSNNVKIGTTETAYSGTPYKITTIRCGK